MKGECSSLREGKLAKEQRAERAVVCSETWTKKGKEEWWGRWRANFKGCCENFKDLYPKGSGRFKAWSMGAVRLDLCLIKIMLTAVDQCVSQLTAASASRKGQVAPTVIEQDPYEGVSTMIVTDNSWVNGQMAAVHRCNGTLLIFNRLTPAKAWMNLKGIMIHHNNPKSRLYIMAHSWCYILQVWTNDKVSTIRVLYQVFSLS